MNKKPFAALLILPAALLLPACNGAPDYFNYVSEYRESIYYYEDDKFEARVYSVIRENPYALDGIKGEVQRISEIYFSAEDTPSEVYAEIDGDGGEMSYLSVKRSFYLSFPGADYSGAALPVTFTVDGEKCELELRNVREEGVIDGKTALKCVTEYDNEAFARLTEAKNFLGEINVRLIYDDGCFYYVGVCDRSGEVRAYLLDGSDGRVLAEKTGGA